MGLGERERKRETERERENTWLVLHKREKSSDFIYLCPNELWLAPHELRLLSEDGRDGDYGGEGD